MPGVLGCTEQPEGVDNDLIGVALNYICSLILACVAGSIFYHHRTRPHGTAVFITELGMSVGYLLGGLVHGSFPNRASDDDCASRYFYPLFSVSYLSMILSSIAWLRLAESSTLKSFTVAALWVAAVIISLGAVSCQATVHLFPGGTDECAPTQQATCDRIMMAGEGLFYLVWCMAWGVVARSMHGRCKTSKQRVCNLMAPVALLLGPGQILAVSVLPVLFSPSLKQGMRKSLELYCTIRTGVTYILAVLLCHLFTALTSETLLFGRTASRLKDGEEEGGGAVSAMHIAPLDEAREDEELELTGLVVATHHRPVR